MNRRRLRQRITAWIAMFAVLLGALMPSVSRAMAVASGDASWIEICTVAGIERIAASADEAAGTAGDEPAQAEKHCPYCVTHAGSFGLAPSAVPVFAVCGRADPLPTAFYSASRPLFAWVAAQPRAPPFHA